MDNDFGEQILADKLSKLNNTQQSIEALSHWCIFHRQKAELVVRTWDKQFHGAREEQRVPFLYLANDIIQNSRRKGNEFVGEFWKILPAALKEVAESGDDRAKSVVSRLVKIWEERKVFGSRAGDLKDFMLGDEPPPALDLSLKRSRSVRIIKRDSRSVKLKLSVGGAAEKIVSAYHAVMSDRQKEDDELRECQAAVNRVGKMEKDVDHACAQGVGPRTALAEELEEQQSVLKECVEKLVPLEKKRAALVHQLREALLEQESELENVRTQMQVARAQIDEAAGMRRRLNNEPPVPRAAPLPPRKSAAAIAAEIADKLTASSRSQQIMTSVLSSFAAEEAKNATLSSAAAAAPPISEGRAIGGAAAHLHHAVVPPPPQYGGFSAPRQYSVQPSGAAMLIGVPYTYGGLPPPLPPPSVQGVNLARPQLTQPPPPPPQQQGIATMQNPTPPPPPPRPIAMPPPSYRPVQSSGMAFYQHRSQ